MHYDYISGKRVSDKKSVAKILRKRKHKHNQYHIPLPYNWNEIRLAVNWRDLLCVECGNKGQGVHHKDYNRLYNDMSNLAYLCWPCHRKYHHKREPV